MLTKKLMLTKGIITTILLLCIASAIINFSCSNVVSNLGAGCIELTTENIQKKWVKKNYTKPASADLINWIKIYTTHDRVKKTFKVDFIGLRNNQSYIDNSLIQDIYTPGTCTVALPTGVSIGENLLKLSDLEILKPDGSLIVFDFIRFTPQRSTTDSLFMNFMWEIMGPKLTILKSGYTNPCPPCAYCVPKCAESFE